MIYEVNNKLMSDKTYVVDKDYFPTATEAQKMVREKFPTAQITRYNYANTYDANGSLLNHDRYFYFEIIDKEENL